MLAIICILLLVIAFSALQYSSTLNAGFQQKQAEFAAQIQEYTDRIAALQETINQKIRELTASEEKLKDVEFKISALTSDSEKARAEFEKERQALLEKSEDLETKLKKFGGASLDALIADVLEQEDNSDVKRVLSDALAKVELIRAGKAVNLEPIVVTGPGEAPAPAIVAPDARFAIITLDKRNNLIAISGGRKDGLKPGDRLTILKGGQEAATASVIAVRYRVASAFVNNTRQNYSFRDISEGDEVVMAEQ